MTETTISELFDAGYWDPVAGFDGDEVTYHRAPDRRNPGRFLARIAFNRPERRNAFRPQTVDQLLAALDHARQQTDTGCVLLTGNGPSSRDGGWAFSSGGDQQARGSEGYEYGQPGRSGRLHILEVQRLIRFMPKVVVAVVPGWAVGGGHSLHVVCDLTIASREHARFLQTDPDVASFDAGYGSALLARQIGQKRAREVFFLGKTYSADEAREMGMVNEVVAHAELERRAIEIGETVNSKSPTAMRMLKYAFNLPDEGLVGQQLFAGEATRLGYGTDEARAGRDAFVEKRDRDFSDFPWHY
ncbi:MAG: 1,4-dihydroxy-2-naphthoyl-CoA synthase [Candidatus Wenzhouxiangella sp. M2_3B_020]